MMRSFAVAICCLTLGLTAAAGAATTAAPVRVPSVTGKAESVAQCRLAADGLRWRFRGDHVVLSHPIIACSQHGAVMPDPRVISQTPRAGARVRRGSVVILDDECLRRVRQHRPPCA